LPFFTLLNNKDNNNNNKYHKARKEAHTIGHVQNKRSIISDSAKSDIKKENNVPIRHLIVTKLILMSHAIRINRNSA
jgi:hypothetical protein